MTAILERAGRRARPFALPLAVSAALLVGIPALPTLADDVPGVVDLSSFSRLADDDATLVEVSLGGALLDLAAGSLAGQDAAMAESIAGLESVNIVILALEGEGYRTAVADLDAMQRSLTEGGWSSIARIRDASSSVSVMLLERDDRVLGLTVGALDKNERQLVLVNIAGAFDPQHLAALLRRFGADLELPELDIP